MKWYLAKIVYRILCGDGHHTAQFDEQLRLVTAGNEQEAFEKATGFGKGEQEAFYNNKQELVHWQFVNVSELYRLQELLDGAEVYSRITEVDDAGAYIDFVHHKATGILTKNTHQVLNLI